MQPQNLCLQSPIKLTNILGETPQFNLNNPKKLQKHEGKSQQEISAILELKKNGSLDEALKRINYLLSANHSLVRCYQIKGEILFELKQYQQSLFCYDQLLFLSGCAENTIPILMGDKAQQKVVSLYYYNKGLCLSKLNRHNDAINALQCCVKLDSSKADAYLSLGCSYIQMGKQGKAIQIFHQLYKRNSSASLLAKMASILMRIQNFKAAIKLIQQGLGNGESQIEKQSLMILKGDCLHRLACYSQAIAVYREVIASKNEGKDLVRIYFKLAQCFNKSMDIPQSIKSYTTILTIEPNNIDALNNLANLQLRQHHYSEALLTLNTAIKLQSSNNCIKALLLRAHRIVALSRLQRKCQAMVDVRFVVEGLSDCEVKKGQQANYRFMREVVDRYDDALSKLKQIQRETKCDGTNKFSSAIKCLSEQIIQSISCDIQLNQNPQDQLKLLAQRIDKLHKQIIEFKCNAVKEKEQTQQRVHGKLQQIEQMLNCKQEEAAKLAEEMGHLKQQYSDIYSLITHIQEHSNGRLSNTIKQLKEQGKQQVAMYAQELYWIFNAYLISIRLVANHLTPQGKQLIHLKTISSFFARFKSVFGAASHVPYIGKVCEAVNSLLTLYLSQQSTYVYQMLNKAITRSFTSEDQLLKAMEQAIMGLAKTGYMEEALEFAKSEKIASQMKTYNRAIEWFRKQKEKAINKIMQFNHNENPNERLIKQQVAEDIGSVLLFIIRSEQSNSIRHYEADLFKIAFSTALLTSFKEKEISSLYEKQRAKQVYAHAQGCSSRCDIY